MDARPDLPPREPAPPAIPHHPPWRLVDRVLSVSDHTVVAEKLVTAGDPLAPDGTLAELLLIEALAQAAACLTGAAQGPHRGMLVQASGFHFEGRARAGDHLRLEATRTATLGGLHRFDGEASVAGKVLTRGQLTFAIVAETR